MNVILISFCRCSPSWVLNSVVEVGWFIPLCGDPPGRVPGKSANGFRLIKGEDAVWRPWPNRPLKVRRAPPAMLRLVQRIVFGTHLRQSCVVLLHYDCWRDGLTPAEFVLLDRAENVAAWIVVSAGPPPRGSEVEYLVTPRQRSFWVQSGIAGRALNASDLPNVLTNAAWRAVALREYAQSPKFPSPPLFGARLAALRDDVAETVTNAPRSLNLCLLGGTGTGKEVLCRSLALGLLARAFVRCDAARLRESWALADLLGATDGAWTGNRGGAAGKLLLASVLQPRLTTDQSFLFLDEFPDMEMPLQAGLLAALDGGPFQPLAAPQSLVFSLRRTWLEGENPPYTQRTGMVVRLAGATSRDVAAYVREGRLREDLLQRMAGVVVRIPSVAEMLG